MFYYRLLISYYERMFIYVTEKYQRCFFIVTIYN